MISLVRLYRIFLISVLMAVLVVALKYVLHILGFEPVEQSSLHNGVISSVTFVIGFLLSATLQITKNPSVCHRNLPLR